ncbi:MAG TPA: hypothetical protein VFV86_03395 [Nitrososphaeraceae archaeon]|nr:hypothetical protein [Nitrososphaeraceae archaeon]
MVDIVAEIKKIEGIEKVVWSEEVFKVSEHKENIMKSFKKYWNSNTNQNNRRTRNNNNSYKKPK